MKAFPVQALVMGHRGQVAYERDNDGKFIKDRDGNRVPKKIKDEETGESKVVIDYKIELGLGIGVPAVELYVNEEKARELADKTGNSFKKGAPFTEYPATVQFVPKVDQKANGKYVNNNLGLRLVDVTPAKAA